MNFHQIFLVRLVAVVSTFGAVLFLGAVVRAEVPSQPLYAGLFIAETHTVTQSYWYVHPRSGERYAISSSDDFSRLLKKVSVGATAKTIQSIPEPHTDMAGVDYKFLVNNLGAILLNVDDAGKAWYVNPLDARRYYLANGSEGFEVIKKLAIDVRLDRLEKIPVTEVVDFKVMNYGAEQLQTEETIDFRTYNDSFELLRTEHLYKDKFTDSDLFYSSLKGMAAGTGDPHTEFYAPAQNKLQQEQFAGDASIEGIGAILNERDGRIYIISVLKGRPADREGLRERDEILAVNGTSTIGMPVESVVNLIKGPAQTSVKLTIFRPETKATLEITVPREKIEIPSVEGKAYDDGRVAYFKFYLFTLDLISEFEKELASTITPATKGIVIDMRDNIGGVTQAALFLSDYWLSENELIMTEKRAGLTTYYYASGGKAIADLPTVILINEETASASEIFAAALQQHKKAKVLGTKSYGKGTGQNLVNFADGSGLKFTTFEWLPPDGVSIDNIGVTPDITLTPSTRDEDIQLDQARALVRG